MNLLLAGRFKVNDFSRGALQRITHWSWAGHPTIRFKGGRCATGPRSLQWRFQTTKFPFSLISFAWSSRNAACFGPMHKTQPPVLLLAASAELLARYRTSVNSHWLNEPVKGGWLNAFLWRSGIFQTESMNDAFRALCGLVGAGSFLLNVEYKDGGFDHVTLTTKVRPMESKFTNNFFSVNLLLILL